MNDKTKESQQVSKSHDLPSGKINYCQVCGGTDLHHVIDLGHQAPCDSLLWPEQLNNVEKTYPLRFQVCKTCSLGQIDYVVPSEELFFPEYPYRSGITATLVEKLSQTAASTLGKFDYPKKSLIIDIGSNDGTVLRAFQERGMSVLGIEATNIAKIANDNGIETIQTFFNENTACDVLESHGSASVICATNVFAHIASMGSVIRGVRTLLKEGGVFVTESHYLMDLVETVQYDSIYHEHLRYYSLKSLIYLFDQYGFTVVDVERIPNYGGSIRVFAVKGSGKTISENVVNLLAEEEAYGLYKTAVFDQFAARARQARDDLQKLVLDIKSRGERVVGIACPGRASTLVNYSGLNPDLMPYIAEQSSSLKLGLFLPGLHNPIVDERWMFDEEPEYAIMLSWHYAEAISANLRKKGLKSQIIVPLPELRVLEF